MLVTSMSTFILYAVILLLVALGGMFAERSGVINIALEGTMIVSGAIGLMTLSFLPETMHGILQLIIIVIVGGVSGVLFTALLSFASITLKADQTIAGTALNVFGAALAVVSVKMFNASDNGGVTNSKLSIFSENLFFEVLGVKVSYFLILAILVLIASCIVLYKTKFGLRLRACGENPHAADSAGINVTKFRYIGVAISGVLAALGGITYCISISSWDSSYGVAGFGFLGLAVMIFGQWKPMRIALSALIFSALKTLAVVSNFVPGLSSLNWSSNIYNMLPFVACLVILAFTSKNSKAPKAEGIPYDKGQR